MVNEGAIVLEERIALRPADIDLVQILGYGFPRRLGGPMHHAEKRGLAELVVALQGLAGEGLAEEPSAALRNASQRGRFSDAPDWTKI